MDTSPKQLTVYLTPDTTDPDLYDGKPAELSLNSARERMTTIGFWRRRHDLWQIEVAIPVNVDIQPAQLKVH